MVGRESAPLLPWRLGRRLPRPGQRTLRLATLSRLLGADLLVLDGYPAASRITRASVLAVAAQIIGLSFDNGLHRSDNRRFASSRYR